MRVQGEIPPTPPLSTTVVTLNIKVILLSLIVDGCGTQRSEDHWCSHWAERRGAELSFIFTTTVLNQKKLLSSLQCSLILSFQSQFTAPQKQRSRCKSNPLDTAAEKSAKHNQRNKDERQKKISSSYWQNPVFSFPSWVLTPVLCNQSESLRIRICHSCFLCLCLTYNKKMSIILGANSLASFSTKAHVT